MLQYRLAPAGAATSLAVREPVRSRLDARFSPGGARHSSSAGGARRSSGSDSRRLLAVASARIEKTREYRRSLRDLQDLVASFRAELNETQNARWLVVEEALLEHAARVNEAFFREGARARLAAGARRQRAALGALAEIIVWLSRR